MLTKHACKKNIIGPPKSGVWKQSPAFAVACRKVPSSPRALWLRTPLERWPIWCACWRWGSPAIRNRFVFFLGTARERLGSKKAVFFHIVGRLRKVKFRECPQKGNLAPWLRVYSSPTKTFLANFLKRVPIIFSIDQHPGGPQFFLKPTFAGFWMMQPTFFDGFIHQLLLPISSFTKTVETYPRLWFREAELRLNFWMPNKKLSRKQPSEALQTAWNP